MIKHGMDVLREATSFLKPGQVPVITLDKPLFALAKAIQWKWPDEYGKDKFVVMLGGLHLDRAMWSTVGDLLDSSGWTTILTEAEVASSKIAHGLLKASHLTRTIIIINIVIVIIIAVIIIIIIIIITLLLLLLLILLLLFENCT